MFATFKLLFVLTAFGPLAGILGIPYSWLIKDIGPLYRVAMRIIRLALKAGGIKVKTSGLENVPTGQSVIYMVNHVSNLDPPVLIPNLPGRCSVLLKKELMRIPILGTAMRMAQFVPVERGHRRDAAAASVAAAASALNSGLNILVFPEGTRARDGRLSTFKKGPFFLAQQTHAPVVPIAISGTERMMRKGSAAIYPGTAHIQFLAPLNPDAYPTREALMDAVRSAIAAALPPEMRPEAVRPDGPTARGAVTS